MKERVHILYIGNALTDINSVYETLINKEKVMNFGFHWYYLREVSAFRVQQRVIISVKRRGGDNHNGRLTQATGEANVSVDTHVTSEQETATFQK